MTGDGAGHGMGPTAKPSAGNQIAGRHMGGHDAKTESDEVADTNSGAVDERTEAPEPKSNAVNRLAEHCGHVFLISPIGRADTKDREHANLVHTLLLEPAGKLLHTPECTARRKEAEEKAKESGTVLVFACKGFRVDRADHRPGTGMVMQKVADQIATADVVAAILTGIDQEVMNSNVMYELGIAHSAVRTVVMLRREGAKEELPFDIKHVEATPYSLDPDKNRNDEQTKLIHKAFAVAYEAERKLREEATTFAKPIFAWGVEGLDPLGIQHRNIKFYQSIGIDPPQVIPIVQHDLFQSVKQPDLVRLYKRAKKRILLVDPQPEFYLPEMKAYGMDTTRDNQIGAIMGACYRDVRVDVLVTDPEHTLLTEMMPGIGETRLIEHDESCKAWRNLAQLAKERSSKAQFRVHVVSSRVLTQRVLATDQEAVVIPRFYGVTQSGRGPCLQLSSATKYFKEIFFDADGLIKEATQSSDKSPSGHAVSVKAVGKFDVISELGRASQFIYWLNPPFSLERRQKLDSDSGQSEDQASWEFINIILGLSIRSDHKRRVVVLSHSASAVVGSGQADDELRRRFSLSAPIWHRYIDAAQQHGGKIRFQPVASATRFESVLVTENAALVLPIDSRLDLKDETKVRAIRIIAGTRQYALLLREMVALANEGRQSLEEQR